MPWGANADEIDNINSPHQWKKADECDEALLDLKTLKILEAAELVRDLEVDFLEAFL